jgi:hypothetical protein
MTDRDFEQRLRDFYRGEVGPDGAPEHLRLRVQEVSNVGAGRRADRRWIVLVAAALLVALVAGTAIAVGTGLLRPPWLPPQPPRPYVLEPRDFTTAQSVQGCGLLDPGPFLLHAMVETEVAGQPTGFSNLVAYDDGWVVAAPTPNAPWLHRQLTGEGLQQLRDALIDPRLAACRTYDAGGGASLVLWAQSGTGVYKLTVGHPGIATVEMHVTTPDQADAVAALQTLLADPDLGLPASAWADEAWSTYTPEQWVLQMDFTEGPGPALDDSVQLPDGTPVRDLGQDDPTATERGITSARCATLDASRAATVRDLLTGVAGPIDTGGTWEFSNAEVMLYPVLPRVDGCAIPEPAPSASPAAGGLSGPSGTDACAYLSADAIPAALDKAGVTWSSRAGSLGDWSMCGYGLPFGSGGPGGGAVYVSRQALGDDPTPSVAAIFGTDGYTTEQIAGHQVFLNRCEPENAGDTCTVAMAIPLGGDFVLLTWSTESPSDLRALASVVISSWDG